MNEKDKVKNPSLSEILNDVEDTGVVTLTDDRKINLMLDGEVIEGINVEGEDVPELRKNRIDYDKYENLTDFFVDGMVSFAHLISLGVPKEFKKDNPKHQEIHSCRNGVKAFRVCRDLLIKQLKTGKSGYQELDDYKYLHEWYVNGIIDFMGITMIDIPDQLNDLDDDKYVVKCAIDAFDKVRKMLLEQVKELTNVK